MSDFIADSCVVAKWFLSEADSGKAARLLTDAKQRGDEVIVLDLVFVEVANVIWKKRIQGTMTDVELTSHLQSLEALPLRVEPARPLLHPAVALAAKYKLPVYDCLFVALSDALDLEGVTSDDRLYHNVHATHPKILLLRTC